MPEASPRTFDCPSTRTQCMNSSCTVMHCEEQHIARMARPNARPPFEIPPDYTIHEGAGLPPPARGHYIQTIYRNGGRGEGAYTDFAWRYSAGSMGDDDIIAWRRRPYMPLPRPPGDGWVEVPQTCTACPVPDNAEIVNLHYDNGRFNETGRFRGEYWGRDRQRYICWYKVTKVFAPRVWTAWRDWDGGPCPVSDLQRVQVKYRGTGLREPEQGIDGFNPYNIVWSHKRSDSDVLAYRVLVNSSDGKCDGWKLWTPGQPAPTGEGSIITRDGAESSGSFAVLRWTHSAEGSITYNTDIVAYREAGYLPVWIFGPWVPLPDSTARELPNMSAYVQVRTRDGTTENRPGGRMAGDYGWSPTTSGGSITAYRYVIYKSGRHSDGWQRVDGDLAMPAKSGIVLRRDGSLLLVENIVAHAVRAGAPSDVLAWKQVDMYVRNGDGTLRAAVQATAPAATGSKMPDELKIGLEQALDVFGNRELEAKFKAWASAQG